MNPSKSKAVNLFTTPYMNWQLICLKYTQLNPSLFNICFLGAVYYPTLVPSTVRDVTEEAVEESADAAPVVTIQHTIDSLPLPPNSLGSNSKFRNPLPPAIPAGIVQATQPTFGQVAIRVWVVAGGEGGA